jgi:hypothetical protein
MKYNKLRKIIREAIQEKLKPQRPDTPRLYNLDRDDILAFLYYLKGSIRNRVSFETTEKYSGSHATVGILGTDGPYNEIFVSTRELNLTRDLYDPHNKKMYAFTKPIIKTFRKYKKLEAGQKVEFKLELIQVDEKKPDYLSYELDKIHFLVFGGTFDEFTQQEADTLSSRHVRVLAPESIQRSPINLSQIGDESINELNSLIKKVKRHGRRGFFKFIYHQVEPQIQNMLTTFFGKSSLNDMTPMEGIFVNMKKGDKTFGFKVPTTEFYQIQKLQYRLYGDIVKERTTIEGSEQRFDELYNYYENETGPTSFGESLDEYILGITNEQFKPVKNIRSFFNPEEVEIICKAIIAAQNSEDEDYKEEMYNSLLDMIEDACRKTKRKEFVWHNMSGDDNYNIPLASQIRRY